jgi:hypothetical protein
VALASALLLKLVFWSKTQSTTLKDGFATEQTVKGVLTPKEEANVELTPKEKFETYMKQRHIDMAEIQRKKRLDTYVQKYKYSPPSNKMTDNDNSESICDSKNSYDSFFAQGLEEHSRHNEDRTIFSTFFNDDEQVSSGEISHNTFIEMGAFDGIKESNSRFFDKCLNWEGLMIEGNPGKGIYDNLVVNRPNAHRMNYVPSCTQEEEIMNKTVTFHSRVYTNAGIETEGDGVKTAYSGRKDDTMDAPCGAITQVILDIFPPYGRVSFYSLDVEGSEHLVLGKALDLDRVFIEMLMIEIENEYCPHNEDCSTRNEVRRIMKEANYARFSGKVRASDIFVRKDSSLLAKAMKAGWKDDTE